jgi:hypothetical protein
MLFMSFVLKQTNSSCTRVLPARLTYQRVLISCAVVEYYTHSCLYGTFLYNTERERLHNSIQHTTTSIWTHVLSTSLNRAKFTNDSYTPVAATTMLTPSIAAHDMELFRM